MLSGTADVTVQVRSRLQGAVKPVWAEGAGPALGSHLQHRLPTSPGREYWSSSSPHGAHAHWPVLPLARSLLRSTSPVG